MNVPDTAVMNQEFAALVVLEPSKPLRPSDKRIEHRQRPVDAYQPLNLQPN